jgi:hypothetical protein
MDIVRQGGVILCKCLKAERTVPRSAPEMRCKVGDPPTLR